MPLLANAGLRVIAIDYRGAGNSSKPHSGYDKRTMAGDIRRLLRECLHILEPTALIGHDIGAMVAYAYAAQFRDEVTHLSVLDSIIPGTAGFQSVRAAPRAWHISFHGVLDLPELLVQGREHEYLRYMIETRVCDPSAITAEVLETYTRAYSAAGAMRAAFELYRALDRDTEDNQKNLREHGRLQMPVQCMTGIQGPLDSVMGAMVEEVAENISYSRIPHTGHWLAEEQPQRVSEELLRFLTSADPQDSFE